MGTMLWRGSINTIDVGMLRAFAAAVECRSISGAAASLDIAQPVLSKKLQKLEYAVGAPLLERRSTGSKPTVFGSAFYAHVRIMLRELERGTVELKRLNEQAPDEIRIGASASLMELVLARALANFAEEWPRVRFRVERQDENELLGKLKQRELDLLLTESHDVNANDDLEVRLIARFLQRVFVRPEHPLAKSASVSFEELQSSRWILQDLPQFRKSFNELFESVSLPPPEPAVLSESLRFLLSMAQHSDLVAIMPEHLARSALEAGRLVALNCEFEPSVNDIFVCYRKQLDGSRAMNSLMEYIEASCSEVHA